MQTPLNNTTTTFILSTLKDTQYPISESLYYVKLKQVILYERKGWVLINPLSVSGCGVPCAGNWEVWTRTPTKEVRRQFQSRWCPEKGVSTLKSSKFHCRQCCVNERESGILFYLNDSLTV